MPVGMMNLLATERSNPCAKKRNTDTHAAAIVPTAECAVRGRTRAMHTFQLARFPLTKQNDDHQTDGKDERRDQRLRGRERAGAGEAGGDSENGAGEHPADEKIGGRERELAPSGFDHGGGNFGGLHIVHISSPTSSLFVGLQEAKAPARTAAN